MPAAATGAAGENLAGLYALVATCEANDINPEEYLADVLLRVQTHPQARIGELLPHEWKRLRAADSSCAPPLTSSPSARQRLGSRPSPSTRAPSVFQRPGTTFTVRIRRAREPRPYSSGPARPSPYGYGQELSAFARRVEAVKDSVSVLEAMASGTVTREHVETLREVYPELHAELRGMVLERVASRTAPVTHQQRLALGFLLGEPMDSSTTPEAVAFYQAQFEVKLTAPPPGPSGARTSKRLAAEYPESLRLQARRA